MKLALNYFDVFFTFVELISVQVSGGIFLFVLFSPLFGIFFIFFLKNIDIILIKNIGFICSLITFFFFIIFMGSF